MSFNLENYAKFFLEVASEQRLKIIQLINENEFRLSELAKKLDATTPEVHRNLERLAKTGFIVKNSNGHFVLTPLGKVILGIIPNVAFVIKNKKYFLNHPIDTLPEKFILRIGDLIESKFLSSYVNVFECWKDIYENSDEYIQS